MNATRVEFAKSLLLLATALNFDLDEAVIGVYWKALKDVSAGMRREAFTRASQMKWFKFPQPGELLTIAATVLTEARSAAAKRHLGDCEHSGHFIEDSAGRLSRCPCWTRAMQAMAEVGAPIALPQVALGAAELVE